MDIKVSVSPECFHQEEKLFLENGAMKAYLFEYPTGISAIRLENKRGYIIVLPFYGQMIWDAVFGDRSLKMHTQFDIPQKAPHFFGTYGCYLMYCGALRAGCPGPDDTHPLHGELPIAEYKDVFLQTGQNERGRYVEVTGEYEYNMAFGDHYVAQPCVKLYEDSGLIDVNMTIENLAHTPMELMFMYHVNYLPKGEIFQSCKWDSEDMKVRMVIPEHAQNFPEGYVEFMQRLEHEPEITRKIQPEHIYDPEICFDLCHLKTDENGNTYFMQVMEDGSGDLVKYSPRQLDCCVRWISRTPNQQTLGMALPATCGSEGYLSEKAKGNVKEILPGGRYSADLQVGYLSRDEAEEMKQFIEQL